MEEQAETMLSGQASRLEHYPHLQGRIAGHLEETKRQAARLKGYLESIGESQSTIKDIGGKLTAMGQAFGGIFASDEVMKGALAGYTFEHMEIASYSILIAAAEELGDAELAAICRENLAEEEAMAEWLREEAPDLTRLFLSRADADSAMAKRYPTRARNSSSAA
jgi:ferritin-like metal-binding protein YciE